MDLSIIIPVYNTSHYLEDCVKSCLNQNGVILGKDYELIFVNDGSTDDSEEVLHRLGASVITAAKTKGSISIYSERQTTSTSQAAIPHTSGSEGGGTALSIKSIAVFPQHGTMGCRMQKGTIYGISTRMTLSNRIASSQFWTN